MIPFDLRPNPPGFRYDDAKHQYFVGDRRISGITEALQSVGLAPDLSNVPPRVLAKAQARGTAAHLLTQLLDEGDLGEYDLEHDGYKQAYEKFKADFLFVPEVIERAICHGVYFFAGRPDRGGTVYSHKIRAVVEIKTTDGIEDWVEFQVALQQLLLEHIGFGPIGLRMAVSLRPDGTYSTRTFKNPQARQIALGAVAISNWKLLTYGGNKK